MNDFSQTFRDLPWSSLIPVGLLIIIGLMLWASGQRILRGSIAVVGLLFGGVIGLILGEVVHVGISPWIGAAIGALVMAGAAALAYRAAVASAMAIILGLAAPLCVITVAEIHSTRAGHTLSEGEAHNPIGDKAAEWWNKPKSQELREQAGDAIESGVESVRGSLDSAKDALHKNLGDQGKVQLARLHDFVNRTIDQGKQQWQSTPSTLRPTLILAAILGAIVGVLLGIVSHSFSAAAVTALGGSLLWVGGVRILAARFGLPDGPWLPHSTMAWMGVWLITSVLGLVIQWTVRRRNVDKPA